MCFVFWQLLEEGLTFRADAEKARVWIRLAMNILKTVTVMKGYFDGDWKCKEGK